MLHAISRLPEDFVTSRNVLLSDEPNIVNGHVNSKTGVLCNCEALLAELKQREDEREAERIAREEREKDCDECLAQRAKAARIVDERQKNSN